MAGSVSMARAMVRSCICPWDTPVVSPESGVSYPWGRVRMKWSQQAALAAATISSRVASSLP